MARGLILKSSRVQLRTVVGRADDSPSATAAACEHAGEPRLQLIHEDGLLAAIELTCACGKTTRFDCLYGGQDAAGELSS
jgi:nitrite reductase/ring-hydroxylating ferredoxin subunit